MDFEMYKRIHTAFNDVEYYDDTHEYFSNGRKLESVTAMKGRFMDKFDARYWSMHEVLKRLHPHEKDGTKHVLSHMKMKIPDQHIAVDDILMHLEDWEKLYCNEAEKIREEWIRNSNERKARGSFIHRYLELGSYGKFEGSRIAAADKFLYDKSYQIPIALEKVVASKCRRFAGQLDRLVWDTKYNWLELGDYKIDEKIEFDNPYGKFMEYPFINVPLTNGGGYIIQLNTYRTFLNDAGIPVGKMVIYNIRESENTYLEAEIPRIDIPLNLLINDNSGGTVYSTRGIKAAYQECKI